MDYIKCHGTGNMFYLIDEYNNIEMKDAEKSSLTIKLCAYDNELDGVLFLVKGNEDMPKMKIFNSDGSEAEMCGNGLRLIGRYVYEKFGKKEFKVETLKALYNIKVNDQGLFNMVNIEIEIGGITSELSRIPLNIEGEKFINKRLEFLDSDTEYSAFSVTNPHLVCISDHVNMDNMENQGRSIIQRKDLLPEGINLSFLKPLKDEKVFVRTYERGVGFTKSCGTGMMSSVTNYCINNPQYFGKKIKVFNDGGMVNITVEKCSEMDYKALFEGNATYIEKGKFEIKNENVSVTVEKVFSQEKEQYSKLLNYKDNEIAL